MYLTIAKPPRSYSIVTPAAAMAALAMICFIAGCDRSNAVPATRPSERAGETASKISRPVNVTVERVTLADLPIVITATGSLFGDEQATISAKVGGRIARITTDVGDRVGPNAVLAEIDPTDYQNELDQKQLAVKETLATLGLDAIPDATFDLSKVATVERSRFQRENAKAKLDRAATLMRDKPPAISTQEFADMQTAYDVAQRDFDVALLDAKARLAIARSRAAEATASAQRLADATVRAPAQPSTAPSDHFAVSARLGSAGEIVSPGMAMFRVVSDRPIKFRGAVPERFAGQITPGQNATLSTEGTDAVPGQISRVNPAIDPVSRTFEIEILTANADGRLRPGAFARASVIVGNRPRVSLVPKGAIVSFAGVDRVFTIKEGKATGVRITPGQTIDGRIAIAEHLPAETPLILRGDRGVAEDVPVEISDSPASVNQSPGK